MIVFFIFIFRKHTTHHPAFVYAGDKSSILGLAARSFCASLFPILSPLRCGGGGGGGGGGDEVWIWRMSRDDGDDGRLHHGGRDDGGFLNALGALHEGTWSGRVGKGRNPFFGGGFSAVFFSRRVLFLCRNSEQM